MHLSESFNLQAAVEHCGAAPGDLLARAALSQALLVLGVRHETWAGLAAEDVADLDAMEKELALEVLRQDILSEFHSLDVACTRLDNESHESWRLPVLCVDPFAAEQRHDDAVQACACRENLHRLAQAAAALQMSGPILPVRLPTVDAVLGRIVDRAAIIAPRRLQLASDLPEATREEHWWLVRPPLEELAPDEPSLPWATDAALAEIRALWQQRYQRDDNGPRLVLTRPEATALVATEEGRTYAAWLGARVDLSAAGWSEWQWSWARVRQTALDALSALPGSVRTWVQGQLQGQGSEDESPPASQGATGAGVGAFPWPAFATGVVEHSAASVGVRILGSEAILKFDCRATMGVPGLGLVCCGVSLLEQEAGEAAWLVIPRADMDWLQLEDPDAGFDADERVTRAEWQGGGLQLTRWVTDDPLVLRGGKEGNVGAMGQGPTLWSLHFAEPVQADPFAVLMRAIASHKLPEARAIWARLQTRLDEETLAALSGLSVLAFLTGENEGGGD